MRGGQILFNKWSGYGLLLLIIFIVQSTLIDAVRIFGVMPNLIICVLVAVSLAEGHVAGGLIGMFAGIFIDVTVADVRGFFVIILLIIGGLLGYLSNDYMKSSAYNAFLLCAPVSFLYNTLIFFTHFYNYSAGGVLRIYLTKIIPEALYTAALAVPMFFIVRAIGKTARLDDEYPA